MGIDRLGQPSPPVVSDHATSPYPGLPSPGHGTPVRTAMPAGLPRAHGVPPPVPPKIPLDTKPSLHHPMPRRPHAGDSTQPVANLSAMTAAAPAVGATAMIEANKGNLSRGGAKRRPVPVPTAPAQPKPAFDYSPIKILPDSSPTLSRGDTGATADGADAKGMRRRLREGLSRIAHSQRNPFSEAGSEKRAEARAARYQGAGGTESRFDNGGMIGHMQESPRTESRWDHD